MPLTTEQSEFVAQVRELPGTEALSIWLSEQMLGGRTLDNIKDQLRRVMGCVQGERTEGKITVLSQRDVPMDAITNAFIGFVENGYSPWLSRVANASPEIVVDSPAYAAVEFWEKGGSYDLTFEDPENDETDKTMRVSLKEIISGLAKMAVGSPKHFDDLVSENDDAITHDMVFQYVVYGDVIYG